MRLKLATTMWTHGSQWSASSGGVVLAMWVACTANPRQQGEGIGLQAASREVDDLRLGERVERRDRDQHRRSSAAAAHLTGLVGADVGILDFDKLGAPIKAVARGYGPAQGPQQLVGGTPLRADDLREPQRGEATLVGVDPIQRPKPLRQLHGRTVERRPRDDGGLAIVARRFGARPRRVNRAAIMRAMGTVTPPTNVGRRWRPGTLARWRNAVSNRRNSSSAIASPGSSVAAGVPRGIPSPWAQNGNP